MKENRHSQAIPAGVIEEARAHVQALQRLLEPYMTILTAEDRMKLLKMGPRTLDFVATAFESAKDTPQILPAHASIREFEIDYTDTRQLFPLHTEAEKVVQAISDVLMVAGSEALQAALMVYASARLGAEQKVSGAKTVFETLKSKYPRGKRRAAPDAAGGVEA